MVAWLRAAALVFASVACVGCGVFQDDEPSFEGKISFLRVSANDSGTVGIFLTTASDGERQVGKPVWSDASWSPDGERLAYSTPEWNIVIASRSRPVEQSVHANCYGPVWSPDSALIACEYTEPHTIYTVNLRDGSVRTLTPNCCLRPAWSPDGRQIAYFDFGPSADGYFQGGPQGLSVMNADGSGRHRLSPRGTLDRDAPAWSPDGRTIAFIDGDDIWTINTDGSRARRIFNGEDRETKHPTWSPDGRRLAFTHGDGDLDVYVINRDGTQLTRITDNKGVQDSDPAWSPDGTGLAFATNRDGNYEIYIANSDGTDPERLTDNERDDRDPTWFPGAPEPEAS